MVKMVVHRGERVKVKKLINLYSAYYNQAMPFLKCFTI